MKGNRSKSRERSKKKTRVRVGIGNQFVSKRLLQVYRQVGQQNTEKSTTKVSNNMKSKYVRPRLLFSVCCVFLFFYGFVDRQQQTELESDFRFFFFKYIFLISFHQLLCNPLSSGSLFTPQ